jgi:hypothetical protein
VKVTSSNNKECVYNMDQCVSLVKLEARCSRCTLTNSTATASYFNCNRVLLYFLQMKEHSIIHSTRTRFHELQSHVKIKFLSSGTITQAELAVHGFYTMCLMCHMSRTQSDGPLRQIASDFLFRPVHGP